MNNDKLREIPRKNYIILLVVIILSLLFIYYLYMWYDAYRDKLLSEPVLDESLEMINYNELDNYLVENPNTIIYVSVLNNKEIYDFEKIMKRELKKNSFDKEFLYMDITDDLKNSSLRSDMILKYSIGNDNITLVPSLIVIKDGKLVNIYNISKNDYDITDMKRFIQDVKFNGDING